MDIKKEELINKNLREFFCPMARRSILRPKDQGIGFKINTGNTLEHEIKKLEIAYNCLRDRFSVIIEGKLKNNKRPDVLILDLINPIAYEVMKSEKNESIKKKEENYLGIKIIKVRI
jgi:hypothetical protein